MINEDVRFLRPTGLALAILVVSILCLAASVVSVALRTYLRLLERVFGVDDALILAGLVCLPIHYVAVRSRSCVHASSHTDTRPR